MATKGATKPNEEIEVWTAVRTARRTHDVLHEENVALTAQVARLREELAELVEQGRVEQARQAEELAHHRGQVAEEEGRRAWSKGQADRWTAQAEAAEQRYGDLVAEMRRYIDQVQCMAEQTGMIPART